MTNRTTVSIMTPNFNGAKWIHETLDSLLSQSYPYWECMVVDDGSTDDSPKIAKEYASRDPRIHFMVRNREPKGACTCRNIGMDHSTGKYVMFLDSDDLLEPFALHNRVQAMELHPELDFGIFPSLLFEKIPHDLRLWWNIKNDLDLLTRQFNHDAPCQGTGALFTRKAFDRLGRWDERLMLWQDIDLFLRAYIQDYHCTVFWELPPDLHNRRNHTSLSRHKFHTIEKQLSRVRIIERVIPLLKKNNKSNRLLSVAPMIAEVFYGLARSRHSRTAWGLLRLGYQQGCIDFDQYRKLRRIIFIYALRLNRLKWGNNTIQQTLAPYNLSPSSMCLVSYNEVPCPIDPQLGDFRQ